METKAGQTTTEQSAHTSTHFLHDKHLAFDNFPPKVLYTFNIERYDFQTYKNSKNLTGCTCNYVWLVEFALSLKLCFKAISSNLLSVVTFM